MPAMSQMKIDAALIQQHGLTEEEYARILEILNREPTLTELGMFSVMWSEHCSYKNSKPVLQLFSEDVPKLAPGASLLVKAGEENAGAISIGDGITIVFKMESHNHPSAVEPFQGAATGVGGILRDIFTMGARPVLLMDSLRFGSLASPQARQLIRGVVQGIAHYGNCMGIPTAGGEVYFDEVYETNPLVNVFCLGILQGGELVRGQAKGIANSVYYVGAATGRDGLGGASFASREITEDSQEDRPQVQVGDPFLEKLLLEACLELIPRGVLVGLQDMGAAGLTCATSETAARGGLGMDVNIAKVPRRERGMTPYEVMLSESQERMLLIVEKGKDAVVEEVFAKWDLHAVKIGEVKEGNTLRIFDGTEQVAEIPAKALATEAPVYIRQEKEPAYLKEVQSFDALTLEEPADLSAVLRKLAGHPTVASKRWVYEKYDHMVRTDTVFLPGHDAALLRIKGTRKAIAASTDGNGLYTYLDPYEGGKIAVAEAARNVAASGAVPLGLTDCLNFGNPMDPEIFWQFHRAVEGIRDASRELRIPVTGGNVSFYNEGPQGSIYPTPVIGVAGVLEDIDLRLPSHFREEGDAIFLMGETLNELGGSQYLSLHHGLKKGLPPRLDFEKERKLYRFINEAAKRRLVRSCHDLSEGGLAVALLESALGLGKRILGVEADALATAKPPLLRADAFLFGETQSRCVVSAVPEDLQAVEELAEEIGLPCLKVGTVAGKIFKLGSWIDIAMEELADLYFGTLGRQAERL
jgi:phosphoribosylformylglycinamidine synthase